MTLEEQIRTTVREAVTEALADVDLSPPAPDTDEGWRSRIHRVHADTRLSLSEVAEALDVSERSVRRYFQGTNGKPALPHRKGPSGLTVRVGDLLQWITDVEDGERWKARRAS